MEGKNWLILGLVIAVIALISFAGLRLTGLTVCRVVNDNVLEEYIEAEPFIALEASQLPIKYAVTYDRNYTTYRNYLFYKIGKLRIKNIDSAAGVFTVKARFEQGDKAVDDEESRVIQPLSEVLFYFEYPLGNDEEADATYTYALIVPDKDVTMTVTKYRNVTRYREASAPKFTCV